MRRLPAIFHVTSQPLRFFGRAPELALLDQALAGGPVSVLGFVGPGGQGKTAIVQHWLTTTAGLGDLDGLFFWSFYRGKDSDLCLRHLWSYAANQDGTTASEGSASGGVSASYCVDHLLPLLRRERWAIVLDGAEVVQHESGAWAGRFVHPELGRLLEELASEPLPGVVALTTRFELPTLARRPHARLLSLDTLDQASAAALLRSLGVRGDAEELDQAARACGLHAKAVELLGTWLRRFQGGQAAAHRRLPQVQGAEASAEECHVARVLAGFQNDLAEETRDVLALTIAFRQPPAADRLLAYLASPAVRHLVHEVWGRRYPPFVHRPHGWLAGQIEELVDLRLLERVGLEVGRTALGDRDLLVLDAHPLVRRGFEHAGDVRGATARAGFLRGRPDRRPPGSLAEAREEVELFHAFCDAGLWNEADGTLLGLDNPKHRFLAPAFERDLLLRFFPQGDWRQPPLWSGFGRYRSLAISLEMLGQYEDALAAYPPRDAPLRGDALLALGRLQPFLDQPSVPHPWQSLWQAYRVHALALLGRAREALALAQTLVPVDVYEWVHLVEALLRLGRLDLLDLNALQYRSPLEEEHQWARLARRRLHADVLRLTAPETPDLETTWRGLVEEYDRCGLPLERAWTRLSLARWLHGQQGSNPPRQQVEEIQNLLTVAQDLARRHQLTIVDIDTLEWLAEVSGQTQWTEEARKKRQEMGYLGPRRP